MEHTYRAEQQFKDGPFTLIKDGQISFCPKIGLALPQPIQSGLNAGQMQIVPTRFPCSTNCPFATIQKENVQQKDAESVVAGTYTIMCEGGSFHIRGIVLELSGIKPHSALVAK